MATSKLYDRAYVATATTGTGTMTLGAAQTTYGTFANQGASDGDVVTYLILDGGHFEVGQGTYHSAGPTLSRDTVFASFDGTTYGTNKINLSGTATVGITVAKEDLVVNNWTLKATPDPINDVVAAYDNAGALNSKLQLYKVAKLPPGFTSSLIQNNSGTPTTKLDVLQGKSRDSTDVYDIVLSSTLTKDISAAWAVGSGNGGLDTGTVAASKHYYIYKILRLDTGVVDGLISQARGFNETGTVTIASPGVWTVNNHGMQAGDPFVPTTTGALPTGITAGTTYFVIATGLSQNSFQFATTQGGAAVNTSGSQSGTHTVTSNPVMPANYTMFQRIGFVRTDGSSHILAFNQGINDPSEFRYATPISDLNSTSVLATTRTGQALSVPAFSSAMFVTNISPGSTGTGCCLVNTTYYIQPFTQTDTAPGSLLVPSPTGDVMWPPMETNSLSQVAMRASQTSTSPVFFKIMTFGCKFMRGIVPPGAVQ